MRKHKGLDRIRRYARRHDGIHILLQDWARSEEKVSFITSKSFLAMPGCQQRLLVRGFNDIRKDFNL